eukprot:scaffold7738_cov133-Cylindrotheca_fusiformis.AAC.28
MAEALPTLRFRIGSTVCPGDRLGNIRQVQPGSGTYVSKGHIYASLVGALTVLPSNNSESLMECSVAPKKLPFSAQALSVGQLVVGTILRITPQNAILGISLAQNVGGGLQLEGAIRREDIRSGATEQLLLGDCFQPGDLVVARVISLGDSRRYFLATAEPELGVIRAKSSYGATMIPVSWNEMKCPETGKTEPRKCAKPPNLKQFKNSNE